MPFVVQWTESALNDLDFFRKYEQSLIVDRIEVQLVSEPAKETRNRKPLEPNALGEWELRLGAYRVFYDVDKTEMTVKIKALGSKEHNTLYIRGREFAL